MAPLLKVMIKLDGVEMISTVDSGAQYCLIEESELSRISSPVVLNKVMRLRGVGDPQLCLDSHRTATLRITIDEISYGQSDFIVVKKLKEGVILGMPFLVKNNIKLNTVDGSFKRYGDHGVKEQVFLMDGLKDCIRVVTSVPVYMVEETVLKKDDWEAVKVEWRSKQIEPRNHDGGYSTKPEELLLEGVEGGKKGYNKRFKIIPGLVKWVDKGGTVLLKKLTPGQLKLGKGEQVGTAHLVVDEDRLRSYETSVCTVNITVQELSGPTGNEQEWTKEKLKTEIKFMEELSPGQIEQILEVLWRQRKVFSRSDADVSETSMTPYRIKLHDYTPIYQRARRFDQRTNEEIEHQVKELCLRDIVEPCAAEWSSPVVPIRKKDGTLRLCVDYRRLNKVTEADRFPMANITETVFGCHGAQYFTSLDLVKGYYQMNLEEGSRNFTAFSTVSGQYRFKRLSFGLKNGPAAFQREMQRILSGFSKDRVVVYVDDVLLISGEFKEHLVLIEQVLQRFCETNVKVKVSKCNWVQKAVS